MSVYEYRGDYIDGAFLKVTASASEGHLTRKNPSRRQEVTFHAPWSSAHVDRAVAAAKAAQPAWDKLGIEGRKVHLARFAQVLEERREELAVAIATEAGKPMWEATGEACALTAKIEIMTTTGASYTADHTPSHVPGRYTYRPLGVLAVLGSFNFPLHLPNGHIIPGLLTGNTLVVKPSELTPAAMQLYFECIDEAGFPPGVLNLVQGPGQVGAALSTHEHVHGVLFTGSYETGLRIKRATLEQHWKLLALEMGGKNTSIVLEDANLDQVTYEVAQAAFLTCGQRCTATSRLVVRQEVLDDLLARLVAVADRVTTGDALSEDVFMGPLINRASFDRFIAAQQDDEGGALRVVRRGTVARPDLDGYFVTPGIWLVDRVDQHGSHQGAELFGPDIVVYPVSRDEEAVQVANATDYGLAMSVFTADESRFEAMRYDLEAGILNLNRSTAGASSALPFGGVKKSGNHRPAAVHAGLYCAYPQSQLLLKAGFDEESLNAGALSKLANAS